MPFTIAEVFYENQYPCLRLPKNFPVNKGYVYVRQNPATGILEIAPSDNPWDELWARVQAIGAAEELPDFKDREPELFRNPLE